jgi:hypothetical protein
MSRLICASALLILCSFGAACDDETLTVAPVDPPVQVTETFSGSITINGAATHLFTVNRSGSALATLTALSPNSAAVVSFAMGTWNGQYCAVTLAKDDATTGSGVLGTASAGAFCVRISDVGRLTEPTDYTITVQHY